MFRIHVWPSAWGLPSLDPLCLSVILYCQLTFPGYYEIVECVDPDTSPTGMFIPWINLPHAAHRFFFWQKGQLPFLTHGMNIIAGTAPIFHYLSHLDIKPEPHKPRPVPKLDATLTELELSQRTAWRAAIEAHLGDLLVRRHLTFLRSFRLLIWTRRTRSTFSNPIMLSSRAPPSPG